MKRNSQSRTEHPQTGPAAPKNHASCEKTQSYQFLSGPPECDQAATPGTAMEFRFKGCVVRSVLHAGEPWFVATDVCTILALSNSREKISELDANEKGVTSADTLWGQPEGEHRQREWPLPTDLLVSKAAGQSLQALGDRDRVPSIRKTGGYQTENHAKPLGSDPDGRQVAPTIVLPGPGRYVATVTPDGAVRVHETEYHAVLEEMTLADCRILCHTLKIIEGHWHKFQHRRSVASDRQDEIGLARLEAAILDGGRVATRYLMWHSCSAKERPGL